MLTSWNSFGSNVLPGATIVLIKPVYSEGDDAALGIVVAAQANSGVDTTDRGVDVDALGNMRTTLAALLGLASGWAGGGVETRCEAVSSASRCRL